MLIIVICLLIEKKYLNLKPKINIYTLYLSFLSEVEMCRIFQLITILLITPIELKYYPFTISLNICSGSCNALSPNICFPKKAKDINVKAFQLIAKKNESKEMKKHISHDFQCKFYSITCNSNGME